MILNILCFYDNQLGAYCTPVYSDRAPEVEAQNLSRFLKTNNDKVGEYLNKRFYHFGTFNDETGEIILNKAPVLLLDTSNMEVRKDG